MSFGVVQKNETEKGLKKDKLVSPRRVTPSPVIHQPQRERDKESARETNKAERTSLSGAGPNYLYSDKVLIIHANAKEKENPLCPQF